MTSAHDAGADPEGGIKPLTATDPTRIGPYLLLGRLGAGGMGRVYLARSEAGRTVAVKVVHEEHVTEPQFRARFRREVAAARRVGERFTAPVLDAAPDGEFPWVATGYVPGLSLEQVVRGHGALPAVSVLVLARGLLHALEDIHGAGIVHRDLKPSNVMLTADGPKVIDFGIARAIGTSVESLLTRTGMVIGSPGFMAPEQIRGRSAGPASDVFTLGCVLTYAATGTLPFGQGVSNQHAVMYRIVEAEPRLDAVGDASLRALIGRCLVKSPDERPSVADLLADLDSMSDVPAGGAWLPAEVMGRLARQSARILDAEAAPAREESGDRGTIDLQPQAAAPAAQGERRGRRRVVALSVPVVLVLAVGGGTVALLQPFGDDGGAHAAPPSSVATKSTTPEASSSPGHSPTRGGRSPRASSHASEKGDAGQNATGGADGHDGRDGEDAEQGAAVTTGGGGTTSGGGGSTSDGGTASGGSRSSDGGSAGGGAAGGDATVPSSFVGSWTYGESYNTGQPGALGISSSGTVRLSDLPTLSCSYEAQVTSASNGGSRVDVGAAKLVGPNPGYCNATLDASYFTRDGSGIRHNVGAAHGSGYFYRRA
ncbi:protein kinase [Streptomyces sp. Q6]|uniref:Protein kinase n=1 Tax=Streptomyces citrinus TaxID=3118173 RepID=A0ACD5AN23_9ACTN